MNNLVFVQELQTDQYIGDEKLCLSFVEATPVSYVVAQVTTVEIVHDEIEVLAVLKGTVHVN